MTQLSPLGSSGSRDALPAPTFAFSRGRRTNRMVRPQQVSGAYTRPKARSSRWAASLARASLHRPSRRVSISSVRCPDTSMASDRAMLPRSSTPAARLA